MLRLFSFLLLIVFIMVEKLSSDMMVSVRLSMMLGRVFGIRIFSMICSGVVLKVCVVLMRF